MILHFGLLKYPNFDTSQNKENTVIKALVLRRQDDVFSSSVEELEENDLPDGDVEVAVEYSSLNYKDGLVLNGLGSLVRNYPHIPGIDLAGTVTVSTHPDFKVGNQVVCTGFRVGELHWGGYAQQARLHSKWPVPLPSGMTTRTAMGLGSAGLTAAIALEALEVHGLKPGNGEVLITGAGGGVGSFSVLLLAVLGYEVVASTGRPELEDYLKDLGATAVIPRSALSDSGGNPLEGARWAGCIDSVGGSTLARLLSQMDFGASVAAVGLAGGSKLETTVIPFLLRGVNLLGIDSVLYPVKSRMAAWERLAKEVPIEKIDTICSQAGLADLPRLGKDILEGKIQGRVIVDVNAQ